MGIVRTIVRSDINVDERGAPRGPSTAMDGSTINGARAVSSISVRQRVSWITADADSNDCGKRDDV